MFRIVIAVSGICFVLFGILFILKWMFFPNLRRDFAALGNVVGKTRSEIEEGIGQSYSMDAVDKEEYVLQWMHDGYHVALLFRGEKCVGIQHESDTKKMS